jgi:hypothetical protein
MTNAKTAYSAILVFSSLISMADRACAYSGNELKAGLDAAAQMEEQHKVGEASGYQAGMAKGYVFGVTDTLAGSVFCFTKTTARGQTIAVVRKYLDAHPEKWDENAGDLILKAFYESFPGCETPSKP